MDGAISLRPVTEADLPFLRRVYGSTREDELAVTGWSREQKDAFLDQQFAAQHTHYQRHYGDGRFDVILAGGEPIGRLYVWRGADEIRIVDIALLAEHRRRGIGSALLRAVLAEAEAAGMPVRIHVEHDNPALALYERLDFRRIGDTGVYYHLERRPAGLA
jgi:ribosomal protein S18 acetylase RimI-like enzyme